MAQKYLYSRLPRKRSTTDTSRTIFELTDGERAYIDALATALDVAAGDIVALCVARHGEELLALAGVPPLAELAKNDKDK